MPNDIVLTIVGMLVRHGLTMAGGYLVAHGVISASGVEPLVGAGVAIAGLVLSYINKRRTGQF